MRRIRESDLLCVKLAIAIAMLAWAIRALFFSGAYSPHSDLPAHWLLVVDASRPERMLAILAGLIVPLVAVPVFAVFGAYGDRQEGGLGQVSLDCAIVALGWYAYPYLGLGVTHAYVQQERLTAYDPLHNPPGMLPLIGGLWYVTAVFAPAVVILVGVCLATVGALSWKDAGRLTRAAMLLGVAVCLLLPLAMPYYLAWILD